MANFSNNDLVFFLNTNTQLFVFRNLDVHATKARDKIFIQTNT